MQEEQAPGSNSPEESCPEQENPLAQASEPQLSAAQELALRHLASGTSISDAARLSGVDRRTIHRWLAGDEHFAAAYNAWRRETVDSGRARVLAMTDLAVNTMHKAMEKGDARVAIQVARATGAMDGPRPGVSDPEQLRRRRALRDGRRELKLGAAERRLEIDAAKHKDPESHAILKDVEQLERTINALLEYRRKAIAAESAEDREERLNRYQEYNPRMEETTRLLVLVDAPPTRALPAPPEADAVPPAAADSTPPDEGSLEANSTGSTDVPAAPAGPAAPDAPLPTRSDAPDLRGSAAASPPLGAASGAPSLKARVRPVRTVHYDGSDESDNDPRWERIT